MSKSSRSAVIIHQVSEPWEWPTKLLEITALFSQPIWKIDGSRLSLHASEMYEQLMARLPSFATIQDNDQDYSLKRLSTILDTLLTTVHALRSYTTTTAATTDHFIHQYTLPLWSSLFNTLGLAHSTEFVMMTDVPFLLPRTVARNEVDDMKFEGRASLLISVYIGPKEVQEEEMDVDVRRGSSSSSSSESVLTHTRFLPLDGPIDGHILPGFGRRIDCVLPVICVADQENIRELVISTTYQRYTWGISLPVIGISIENTGTITTVIIGWINDGERTDNSELPPVHLASSSGKVVNSSLGIFDLSDPISSLRFAQFILSLRSQFSAIVANLGLQRRDLCWRMDHLRRFDSEDPHMSVSLDRRARIEKWLEGIDSWDRDPIEPFETSEDSLMGSLTFGVKSPVPTSSSMTLQNPVPELKATYSGYPRSRGSTEPSAPGYYTASAFAALSDAFHGKKYPGSRKSQLDSTSFSDPARSRYSASTFTQLKDTLIDARPGIEHWLWERGTVRVACIKMKEFNNDAQIQINEMIDHYTNTLTLAWPGQWQTMNHDPSEIPCDPVFRDLLELLFEQYKTYSISRTVTTPTLGQEEFACLSDRLSMFLSAVSNVRHRVQQTRGGVVLDKLKMRDPIDLLLNLFWCEKEKVISDSYFQDCNIRFAKNKAIEGNLHDQDQAFLWGDIAWQQLCSLGKDPPLALLNAIGTRLEESGDKNIHMIHHPYPQKLEPEKRRTEPYHGIADGLASIRVLVEYGSVATSISRFDSQFGTSNDYSPQYENSNTQAAQSDNKLRKDATRTTTQLCQAMVQESLVSAVYNRNNHPFLNQHPPIMLTPRPEIPERLDAVLPCLVVKYYQKNSQQTNASRQCQMCCISAVELLASIGIFEFPIYGLVVDGSRVSIMMAWHCRKPMELDSELDIVDDGPGFNVLVDQNLTSFDIAEPLDAYRFAITIHRIFQTGKKLADLLKDADRP